MKLSEIQRSEADRLLDKLHGRSAAAVYNADTRLRPLTDDFKIAATDLFDPDEMAELQTVFREFLQSGTFDQTDEAMIIANEWYRYLVY